MDSLRPAVGDGARDDDGALLLLHALAGPPLIKFGDEALTGAPASGGRDRNTERGPEPRGGRMGGATVGVPTAGATPNRNGGGHPGVIAPTDGLRTTAMMTFRCSWPHTNN